MSTDNVLRRMSEAHLALKLEELGKEHALRLMKEVFRRDFVEVPHHAHRVSAWYERDSFPYDGDADHLSEISKFIWQHPNWDRTRKLQFGTGWIKEDDAKT